MKTVPAARERIENAFVPTPDGVLSLVNEVLALASEHDLSFEWQDDRCHVRMLDGGECEEFDVALPQSAFRALLARIAALCNEYAPGSVSPYGGNGRLAVGASSPRVAFVNRPGEQRLSVSRAGPGLQVGAS